jgi:hypothetical protein
MADCASLRNRSSSAPMPDSPAIDPAMHTTLTDLHAFALLLHAQAHDISHRADELARSGGRPREVMELRRHSEQIRQELQALRRTAEAFRLQADPRGTRL